MTNLISPKTDWTGSTSERFNVDPDYNRIKNNIIVLFEVAKQVFKKEFAIYNMEELIEGMDHVYIEYLNNITYNLEEIRINTYTPLNYATIGVVQENGSVWNFKDLNDVEKNTLIMYNLISSVGNLKDKVGFKTMGLKGGL